MTPIEEIEFLKRKISESQARLAEVEKAELLRDNVMGRIAIAIYGDANNVTDEVCVEGVIDLKRNNAAIRQSAADDHWTQEGRHKAQVEKLSAALAQAKQEIQSLRSQ